MDEVKLEKKKSFCKGDGFWKGLVFFLSFFAPFAIMLAIFAGNSIYPFGDRSFAVSDMYHQYVPFFEEFVRKLRGGEGLAYSWNVGMGSNFLALYGYYLASPFHFLAFLFPDSLIMEFMSYLVVVKIGLCGLSACLYLEKRARRDGEGAGGFFALLVSCFYAMSGFVAAYNYNVMWLDCIVLAPIILMGLERLVYDGHVDLYVLSLGLCIFTNFYISIMICIFLVIYYVFLFLTEKRNLRMILQFLFGSLLAGGLAAALLIPEVCALLATDFGDSSFPEKWKAYFSVLEILARHCTGITVEKALEHWPNIYCGAAVFLMIPLYAWNEKIPLRKRFGFFAIAGFFLLSFGTNVLDFIWHGFNYPDSLPARQSFLYILLLLVMCHDCLVHRDGIQPKGVLKAYLGAVTALLLVEQFLGSDDFHTWDWLMTLAFVTGYAICLHFYLTRSGRRARAAVAMLCFVLVLAESSINMSLTSVGTVDRTAYYFGVKDYTTLYERNASSDDFQRMEKYARKTKNDATLAGFPSASVFSSTMNSQVMDFYTKLGMRHSKVFYCYDGATAFSSALLNVGYLFAETDELESEIYYLADKERGLYLYQSVYQLPFGYVAPKEYDLEEGLKYNGITQQNKLVEKLGIDGSLFQKVKASDEGNGVEFTPSRDGIYYGLVTDYGTTKIKMSGATEEEYDFKDLKKDCILFLGSLSEGQTITLVNGDKDDETPNISVSVFRLNVEVLQQAIDKLGQAHLTELRLEGTSLSGYLELEEEGRLITSIPYEAGWTVYVNGEQKKPAQFGKAFLALDLEPGSYEIEMRYVPKGKREGILISCGSVVLFLAGYLPRLLKGREKKRKEKNWKSFQKDL